MAWLLPSSTMLMWSAFFSFLTEIFRRLNTKYTAAHPPQLICNANAGTGGLRTPASTSQPILLLKDGGGRTRRRLRGACAGDNVYYGPPCAG